jgi:hypothetical protein
VRPVARAAYPFLWLLSLGCSNSDSATIQLVTGGETDTFTQPPAPVTLLVQSVDSSNNKTTLAQQPLPATSVDLGTQSEANQATLTVAGLDAAGGTLVYGQSLYLDFGALVSETVPIFVQRVDEAARLPGTLDARTGPVLSTMQGEYVLVVGGNEPSLAATSQLYDYAQLQPLASPPVMPVVPVSAAVVGTVAMLFDGTENAYYFDFSDNAEAQVPALAGGSLGFTFADVAGGQTIVANDGTTYVVGATRTVGTPTAAVLEINPSDTSNSNYVTGNLSWLSLSAPRFGAAAVWVDGKGIVVAGGSPTAPGVEILSPSSAATTGSALSYPIDPTVGAGAATTDDANTVVLAGGLTPTGADPGTRAINLSCPPNCTTTPWASLPIPLGSSGTFAVGDPAHVLVVGNELASGLTHVFLTGSDGSASEIPTKVAHTNARAVITPVGSVLIVGGNAQVESVLPMMPAAQ